MIKPTTFKNNRFIKAFLLFLLSPFIALFYVKILNNFIKYLFNNRGIDSDGIIFVAFVFWIFMIIIYFYVKDTTN